jgi:hypothetical protein
LALLLNDVQGTAARAFLQRLVRDERAASKLKSYSAEFLRQAESALGDNVHGRIATNFAVIAAASRLAIDYGVLNWKYRATWRDIRCCLLDALAAMNTNNSDTPLRSDEELLRDFHKACAALKILNLDTRKKSSIIAEEVSSCDAFLRTLRGNMQPTLLLKSNWLKTRYAKEDRKRLLNLLFKMGMVTAGRASDTLTHQERICGRPIEVYRVTAPVRLAQENRNPSAPASQAPQSSARHLVPRRDAQVRAPRFKNRMSTW